MKRLKNRVAEIAVLKSRREGRKITQMEIAKETGLAINTVSRYFLNQVERYDGDCLIALAEYFGVEIGDLFVIEDMGDSAPEAENPILATA